MQSGKISIQKKCKIGKQENGWGFFQNAEGRGVNRVVVRKNGEEKKNDLKVKNLISVETQRQE